MDEDDEMAALAHQQELEAEEAAIEHGRELMNQSRAECVEFDQQCKAFWERMRKLA